MQEWVTSLTLGTRRLRMGLRRAAGRRPWLGRSEIRLLVAMACIFFLPMFIYLGMHPQRMHQLYRRAFPVPRPPPVVHIPPGSSLPGVPTYTTQQVTVNQVVQPVTAAANDKAVGEGSKHEKEQGGVKDVGSAAAVDAPAAAAKGDDKAAAAASNDQLSQPEGAAKVVDDGEGHEDVSIDLEQEADHAGPRNRKNRDKKGKGRGEKGKGDKQEGKDKKGRGGGHKGKGNKKGDGQDGDGDDDGDVGGGGGGRKHRGKHQEGGGKPASAVRGSKAGQGEVPWPFYKIGDDMDSGEGRWPWPGVGWKEKLSVDDDDFMSTFKFYLYDEGPMNLEDAIKCFHKHRELDQDLGNIDSVMRVNEREYFTEFFILPALKNHPQRTLVKSEASLFIVGWSNMLARYANPCKTEAYGDTEDEWDDKVASLLEEDAAFKKKDGRNFLFLNSRYKQEMSKKLKSVLDSGPIIATFDRFSGKLMAYWRKAWKRGSVLVLPYVSSAALDLQHETPSKEKDPNLRYYFRGNMHRWHGERSYLPKLAEHLTGADFREVVFTKVGGAANFVSVLEESAKDVRRSSVCPSPEGDTPTSLRLFESLVAGCVPVVIGQVCLFSHGLQVGGLGWRLEGWRFGGNLSSSNHHRNITFDFTSGKWPHT